MMELKRIAVEAEAPNGITDEFASAVVTDDGIYIEGFFSDTVGISWGELARLLEDPLVKAKLEEADLIRSG